MPKSKIRWRRVLRLTFVALILIAFLLPLLYGANWANYAVQPARSSVPTPDFTFPYETIRFTSRDGVELAGWYVAPQNGIVILLTHGYDANRAQLAFHTSVLVEVGYGVLVYDMRGHGESGGERRSLGWLEVNDLLGALDYARSQAGVEHFGAFGFSIGGQVTLRAAATTPEIEAVVGDGASAAVFSDSPPPVDMADVLFTPFNWWSYTFIGIFSGAAQPLSVIDTLPQIAPHPIFLIATSSNRELRQLTRYCETAGDNCTLWNIPETGHGGGWSARPEEYTQRLVDFFNAAFGIEQ